MAQAHTDSLDGSISQRLGRLVAGPPALVTMAMVMWMVTEAAGAAAFRGDVPIPQIVWLRYGCHLALMLALLGAPNRFAFTRTGRPALQVARSLLMLVMPLCFAAAAGGARTGDIMGVFWAAPVIVMLFGLLTRETAPPVVWLATVAAWAGATVLYRPPVLAMGWAFVASLGMAASFGGYIVLTRVLDRTEPLLTNLFYSALGVFVSLSAVVPFVWVPVNPRHLAGAIGLAVFGWVSLYLLELGLRRDSPSKLAPFLFTLALLDGGLRFGSDLIREPVSAAGTVAVLAALGVAFLSTMRARHDTA